MNSTEESHLKLIETIFTRFRLQTQSDNPQLSRDYFERFTQLLNQTIQRYPQLKSSVESILSSTSYPFHPSNVVTFEYQLRLARFSFRQHLHVPVFNQQDFLTKLFHHPLLSHSSIVRHLALQIATLSYEQDSQQAFDEAFFAHIIRLLSPDPNLYVRNTLAQFLALYISKHDQYPLFNQIRQQSANPDLMYNVIILLDDGKQQMLIEQLNIYETLSDSAATRAFVLKTAKHLSDEDYVVFYLNRILVKSIADYVHMLLSVISSRAGRDRPIVKLTACLKAMFLYMQETEIEEIDENAHNVLDDQHDEFGELTEYLCCQLYERNIEPAALASIVLDGIQPLIVDPQSFLYRLDFYPSTIMKMLTDENHPDKVLAQLIVCLEKLPQFTSSNHALLKTLIAQIKRKNRATLVYQSLFSLILRSTNNGEALESIDSIVEILLFQDTDKLWQWDNKDCVLHFLTQLAKSADISGLPSWLTKEFLRRLIDKFVQNTNEYIQGGLIDFLAALVEYGHLSPLDDYLTSNFIQLTEYSLGDVVRCALAHAWYIILNIANDDQIAKAPEKNYVFSFGANINRDSLTTIVTGQIPLLIGDGGQETEVQCIRLIEYLGRPTTELENVLDFLVSDGCSMEIKEKASRLLSRPVQKLMEEKKNEEILGDELASILHWLDHPDEHMILDCD